MRKIILTLLFLIPLVLNAQKGKFNDNVTWNLRPSGTLEVNGTGEIKDIKKNKKSVLIREQIADKVKTLDLSEFNGYIGQYVFYGLNNLDTIRLRHNNRYNFAMLSFDSIHYIKTIEYLPAKRHLSKRDKYYRMQLNSLPDNMFLPFKNNIGNYIVVSNSYKESLESKYKKCLDLISVGIKPIQELCELKYKATIDGTEYYQYQWDDTSWFVSKNGQWRNNFAAYFEKYHLPGSKDWIFLINSGDFSNGRIKDGVRLWIHSGDTTYFFGKFFGLDNESGVVRKGIWKHTTGDIRLFYGETHEYIRGSVTSWGEGGKGIRIFKDGTVQYGLFEEDKYIGGTDSLFIDEFLDFPEILPFEIVAKNYIEYKIAEWQKKGEFETTQNWRQRVTEESRKKMVPVFLNEVQNIYLKDACQKIDTNLILGKFDADNNTYIVKHALGTYVISLTGAVTPQFFKKNWNSIVPIPTYAIEGNQLVLKDLTFWYNNKLVAKYDNSESNKYNVIMIDYVFDPIDIYWGNDNNPQINKFDTITTLTRSETDINIPTTKHKNNSTYAFIIANENYPIQNVPFALNDGRIFAQYCIKTLGLKRDHVILYENATFGKLMECVEQMKNASKANDGKLDIIFYYAGHAFPDEESKTAWLLPVDGKINLNRTCYSLKQLYNDFADVNANSVVCFIDACFSGATLKKEGRGVAITVKDEIPPTGNIIVFTASTGNETAHQYQEKSHGLFTYYLLKKLQDSKGDVTLGELDEYITTNVKRASFEVNQNLQTPTVIKSLSFQDDEWKSIKLVK